MRDAEDDGSVSLPHCVRKREPPCERMRHTCELMRDRLLLIEEQLENLLSDLAELQLKEENDM